MLLNCVRALKSIIPVILQMERDVIVLTVGGQRAKYGAAKGIVETAQLVYPWITRDRYRCGGTSGRNATVMATAMADESTRTTVEMTPGTAEGPG